jgi:hypothetical protein
MTDHIPDPHRHRTLFDGRAYGATTSGHYANRVPAPRGLGARTRTRWQNGNRVRGERAAEEPGEVKKETPKKRRCTPSWARLISKVYNVDPLTCRTCGGKLKVIAYITDAVAIGRIPDSLGLSPPKDSKPPPAPREVVRAPLNEDGWEIGDHP